MSTYSTSLGLEEITPGDQAGLWGNTTNTNLSLIDQAIAGVTPVSLGSASGSTYVLTYYNGAVDESRSAVIKVTGTATGPNIIQIPAVQKLYVFRNNSGDQITVQTAAAANTVTLKDGEATLVFCDGANAYSGIATAGVGTITVPYGGTGATSFGAGFIISPGGTGNIVSVPYIPLDASSAAVSGVLPVANGGTGQSTLASGSILTGNGTSGIGSISASATPGWVLTTNGSSWAAAPAGSALLSSNNTWSGTNAFNTAPTVGGYSVVTTNTLSGYAPLNANNTFTATGTSSFGGLLQAQSFQALGAGSIGDQKFTVAYTSGGTTYNGGLSSTTVQLGASGYGGTYVPAGSGYDSYPNIGFIAGTGGASFSISHDPSLTLYAGAYTCYKGGSSTSWVIYSDSRIKKNVVPYTKGLSELNQIQIKNFEFNGLGNTVNGKKGIGVIADEVEKVLPDSVTTMPTKLHSEDQERVDLKTFDNTEMIYLLVTSVQELSAELEALKAKVGT